MRGQKRSHAPENKELHSSPGPIWPARLRRGANRLKRSRYERNRLKRRGRRWVRSIHLRCLRSAGWRFPT